MKKIFMSFVLVTFLSLSALFAQEKISFQIDETDNDLFNISRDFPSMNNFNPPAVINYAKVLTDEQANKVIKNIELANMVLSIITITGYTTNTILGSFVLAEKFQDMPYWNGILYAHIPIGITSGLLGATVISLGYVDLGLRNKYRLFNNKANAISIYINTGLAIAEIGFVVANLVTSRFNPEAAKWIGLAHAITTACLMVGVTVQLGTSFIKN